MTKTTVASTTWIIACLLACSFSYGQKISESFEFQFEGKTLRGLIEKPKGRPTDAMVILIPGYGRTNYVEGNWYSNLRDHLVAMGLTVCFWDKMGCGKSDGEFDAQQPVENSAMEAISAIREIKRLKIAGAEKIGLWGQSRAGWICPLINEQFPVDFWISVSGTDDKENFGYLLKSNLIIAGKSEQEAEKLFQAWSLGHKIFCTNGKYEDDLKATQPLRADSTCRKLFGYTNTSGPSEEGRKNYLKQQRSYTANGHFDEKSGLWVYIEDFDEKLRKFNCPVLALFGANDSQVDWRKTKKLYEQTIGSKPGSPLTTKVFDQCNHNLQKCITCAYREDLSALKWAECEGYYQTMTDWLRSHKMIN